MNPIKIKEVYDKLVETAKRNNIISYQTLSNECSLGLDMADISHRNKLADIIGTISHEENENGRPLLSVVVIRSDSNQPGNGFFNLATELELYGGSRDDLNRLEFSTMELRRCHDYWN